MYSLAIHGGAGTITRSSMTPALEAQYTEGLRKALTCGEKILSDNGSALDAVQAAVEALENFPLFNAGKGSVFTHDGIHEMDASIMNGSDLRAGAIAGVTGIKNPVKLARMVMDHSEHVLLAGVGAIRFAELMKLPMESAEYFHTDQRYAQWQDALKTDTISLDHSEKKFGTVGAVALDLSGNLAASTSTGGMTNKKFGRVGDSPIIGSGTYANNLACAVSCTGHGEFFIRSVVAYDVFAAMHYGKLSLQEACRLVVENKLVKIGGEGGLIAVDNQGNIELCFNSEGMYRGSVRQNEACVIQIYK